VGKKTEALRKKYEEALKELKATAKEKSTALKDLEEIKDGYTALSKSPDNNNSPERQKLQKSLKTVMDEVHRAAVAHENAKKKCFTASKALDDYVKAKLDKKDKEAAELKKKVMDLPEID